MQCCIRARRQHENIFFTTNTFAQGPCPYTLFEFTDADHWEEVVENSRGEERGQDVCHVLLRWAFGHVDHSLMSPVSQDQETHFHKLEATLSLSFDEPERRHCCP